MKKPLLFALLCLFASAAGAEEPAPPAPIESPPPAAATEPGTGPAEPAAAIETPAADEEEANPVNEVVSVGHDAALASGEKALSVVAVFGSASSAGEVSEQVVAVLGDTHVTGPVGDGVVSVLGNSYVNSVVGGDVVAVLGDIELGPEAKVKGQVVVVGGTLKRDPAAVVDQGVEKILGGNFVRFDWLHPWIKHCLLYGRPLAIAPGLGWAWGLALGFLALYVLLAFLFQSAIERCVETLETQPGRSILTAVLTVLITPVLFILLCITVIGVAVVPFLALGLFCASLFGKATVLAWLGKRFTRLFGDSPLAHSAVAVLIGGVIVLALYLVPILGFIIYNLVGVLGLGVVVYVLIQSAQRTRSYAPTSAAVAAAAGSASTSAPAFTPTPTGAPSVEPEISNSPVGDAATLPRAGFWLRMGALFLDVVLIGIILAAFHNLGHLELLLLAVYGAVMWKLKGTTIGGIVCGLRVVRIDGRPIDWPTSIVRALSCFLSLAIAGLGFFWIVFDDGKQAWHDKIAGTVVVRAPKGASLV